MHDLLRDDPSIDKSAVVNSRTIKGLDLLRNKKQSEDEDEMEESDGPAKLGSDGEDEEEQPITPGPAAPAHGDFTAPDTQVCVRFVGGIDADST
jgi:hypothetical protein